ncbi:DnaD domain-containing protein [Lactococcus garvieae]|uniref:Chromosome replication initiation protein dnaD n=1 Tax=Lactococcus garvieae DCC43 TaxID=1231377 RepID=K2PTE2_9LACT|nr:DnaD domain-containing protein [Lactococcus garvieae]EKF50771.1 Chromosome replication initiation protein dnaD [Lactococcus garvieae DCC43]
MTYYENYIAGHIILPHALLEHFAQLFPSAEDFLVWLYLYENRDSAPSDIAAKIGKKLSDVNRSIDKLQEFGSLKVTLLEISGDMETIFDVTPALKRLDELSGLTNKSAKEEENPPLQNKGQLQELVNIFEAEMGMITPMQSEELRILLFEEKYDLELIKLALREAVVNRKISLNYIKAILRNWRNDGLMSTQAVEQRKEERTETAQSHKITDFYIPMDGPWNGK